MTFTTRLRAPTSVACGLRLAKILVIFALCGAATGCGVLAAPCRVTSAALKMVPLVGHIAALPTDGCAAVIDP